MPIPLGGLTVVNLDAGTDRPDLARAEIISAVQKINEVLAKLPLYADGEQNGTGTQRVGLLKVGAEAAAVWPTTWRVIDIGGRSVFYERPSGVTGIANNLYPSDAAATSWLYRAVGTGSIQQFNVDESIQMWTAPSAGGTGTAAVITDRLRLGILGISFTGLPTQNVGVEIGSVGGSATTPFVDFHSGVTVTDYDSRIIASGGTGVAGGGAINIVAAGGVSINGNAALHTGRVFHGRLNADGTAARLPSGWTSTRVSAGLYTITHNLGIATYSCSVTPLANGPVVFGQLYGANTSLIGIRISNDAGTAVDIDHHFIMILD